MIEFLLIIGVLAVALPNIMPDMIPLRNVVRQIITRNLRDYDTVIVIDTGSFGGEGGVGTGKSDFAQQLAILLNPVKPPYHMDKHTVFKDDWNKFNFLIFRDTRRFYVTVVDEAHNFLFARDHSTRAVKDAVKRYMTKRELNRFDILCTPTIWELEYYTRTFRVQYRFKVIKRGLIHVFRNSGYLDKEADRWGKFITKFRISGLPRTIRREYEYYRYMTAERLELERVEAE